MTEDVKPTQAPEQVQQESADLTISDLQNIKAIIDLASTRGSFRPNEMVAVGTVYAKLNNFLGSIPTKQNGA